MLIKKTFEFFDSAGVPAEFKPAWLEAIIRGYVIYLITPLDEIATYTFNISNGKIMIQTGMGIPRIKFSIQWLKGDKTKTYVLRYKVCSPSEFVEVYDDILSGYEKLKMKIPDILNDMCKLVLLLAQAIKTSARLTDELEDMDVKNL